MMQNHDKRIEAVKIAIARAGRKEMFMHCRPPCARKYAQFTRDWFVAQDRGFIKAVVASGEAWPTTAS